MKINLKYIYPLFFFSILIYACKKESQSPKPTELKIAVTNAHGNPAASYAYVTLYKSIDDYFSRTNPYNGKYTDLNGVATFSYIDTGYYCWSIEYGCEINNFFVGGSSGKAELNTTSIYNTSLIETGTLQLYNSSSDQYEYYYQYIQNGFPINSGDTLTFNNELAYDSLKIRIVQVSGIVNNPYDSTFYVDIYCGITTLIKFP